MQLIVIFYNPNELGNITKITFELGSCLLHVKSNPGNMVMSSKYHDALLKFKYRDRYKYKSFVRKYVKLKKIK